MSHQPITSAVLDLIDRPIAFQRAFVALGVGVTGALMLSQAVYWSKRTDDKRGWFYKSQEEWEEETGLKRAEQETARKRLIKIGVLEEERRGLPARLFYRVNKAALQTALNSAKPGRTRLRESSKLECDNQAIMSAGKPQAGLQVSGDQACGNPAVIHTEITTETTTESSPVAENPAPATLGVGGSLVLSEQKQAEQGEHREPSYEKIRATFWERFDQAYQQKYGATLPRNAKTNSQVKALIQRLGKEAPAVACFYVANVTEPRVLMASHTLDFLLLNAEGYRTQWIAGRAMTAGRARQIDSTQTNASVADEALAMLRARREREGGQ